MAISSWKLFETVGLTLTPSPSCYLAVSCLLNYFAQTGSFTRRGPMQCQHSNRYVRKAGPSFVDSHEIGVDKGPNWGLGNLI